MPFDSPFCLVPSSLERSPQVSSAEVLFRLSHSGTEVPSSTHIGTRLQEEGWFDEEGWLKTGDAVRLAEPDNPAAGLLFDGRTAENFKLSSGTWVNVGTLRTVVIAAGAPVIEDAVITGHDRDEIGLLIFPSLAGLRGLCPDARADAGVDALIAEPAVRRGLIEGLARHNARVQGSSMRVARCLLLTEPPSIDANEITDKGYLNQRAVLAKRAALVERLHAVPAPAEVIVVG